MQLPLLQNLLLELFVEELPPKALQMLGNSFKTLIFEQLQKQDLLSSNSQATAFATPRRLAVHITDVLAQAPEKAVRQKLMPVNVGLDAQGIPTAALLKKLQSLGLNEEAARQCVPNLEQSLDGKAATLFYCSVQNGTTLDLGLQKALEYAIQKLPIPKVMTYQLSSGCQNPGWDSVSFVRPVHGVLALHGAKEVAVQALGLQAGRMTKGHRFEAINNPIEITHADTYETQLKTQGAVIASFQARKSEIQRQLKEKAQSLGEGVYPIEDAALLDEVTALVERPNVLVCSFEPQFLQVPQEALILTMKVNQKYFPLLDANHKLMPQFLVVSNISPQDPYAVISGNERVVRPRLADAKFFFDQDRKKTLQSRLSGLEKVVYHNQLGTQAQRSERVQHIASYIGTQLGVEKEAVQAAQLCKADLLTDMVGEFPELQGVMGRYYAVNDGLDETIANAIEDHYKPRFAGDQLPRDRVGLACALADKLETLVGMFAIGNLPTGEKDPFGLRRHALGVVRMLIERNLPLNLPQLLEVALKNLGTLVVNKEAFAQLVQFIYERLAGFLREQGYSTQEVEAVISQRPAYINMLEKKLQAVRAFSQLNEAQALAQANKRIANILKKSETTLATQVAVDPALLVQAAEKILFDTMQEVVPSADKAFDEQNYNQSLKTLAALKDSVDHFFNEVMVNDENMQIRANRYALLQTLHGAMNRVADLSKLAV